MKEEDDNNYNNSIDYNDDDDISSIVYILYSVISEVAHVDLQDNSKG